MRFQKAGSNNQVRPSAYAAIKNVILIVLISWFAGSVLLIGAESLPVDRIIENVNESYQRLIIEGDYPLWGGTRLFAGDNVTDAAMIQQATYDGNESAVNKAMLNHMKTADYDGPYINRALDAVGKSDGVIVSDYPRYWHGYLIFLKPLLLIFNIHQIRTLNMAVMISLMFFCAALIQKRLGTCYLAVFITCILFINPITSFFSFQFAPVMYIMLLMIICLLLIKRPGRGSSPAVVLNVFMIGGILCAYFDLLTYPVVALGVPLIFEILLMKECSTGTIFKRTVSCSALFSIGYAFMWSGKWIISSIVTKTDIIGDAVRQTVYRASSTINEGDTFISGLGRLDGLKMNFSYIQSDPIVIAYAVIIVVLTVILGVLMMRKKVNISRGWIYGIAAVSLYPFAWYIAVLNHSFHHPFIAYRDFAVFFTAVMAVAAGLLDPYFTKESNRSN